MSKELKEYIGRLISEIHEKPYDYWRQQEFPITWETVVNGKETQVEIDALEITPEYIRVVVEASDSPFGWWFRNSAYTVISREGNEG